MHHLPNIQLNVSVKRHVFLVVKGKRNHNNKHS